MINNMNTVYEMNARQLNVNLDIGEEATQDVPTPNHTYNLRPRPTRKNSKYNMTQMGQQSTFANPHVHIMLTQMIIREGIKKTGDKESNVLLKDLNKLHERNVLLPKKKGINVLRREK